MHHYQQLNIWKESMDLVLEIYQLTDSFPQTELFGLTSQMRRAAISVPSNIAEGAGRLSTLDFRRFLNIALGSLCELHTQLILSKRLALIEEDKSTSIEDKIDKIKNMIYRFAQKLNS